MTCATILRDFADSLVLISDGNEIGAAKSAH